MWRRLVLWAFMAAHAPALMLGPVAHRHTLTLLPATVAARERVVVCSSENDDLQQEAEPRLSTPPETLAAAAVGTGLAAAAGLEVLDAGVVGSSLLVGAALAWAAENEKEYGVGDVARGLGRMGWRTFKTMRSAQTIVEQTKLEQDSFQSKLELIRKGIEEDRKRMAGEQAADADQS